MSTYQETIANDRDSMEELGTKLRLILGALEPIDRANIYVQFNCYLWPEVLVELKPVEWGKMLDSERHRDSRFQKLREVIYEMTSPFDRSQAWWREKLGRSKEEQLEWWLTHHNNL